MRTSLPRQLFPVLLLAVVVFLLLQRTAPRPEGESETKSATTAQTPGTQLLWESLSRQFVASVPY